MSRRFDRAYDDQFAHHRSTGMEVGVLKDLPQSLADYEASVFARFYLIQDKAAVFPYGDIDVIVFASDIAATENCAKLLMQFLRHSFMDRVKGDGPCALAKN